MAWFFLGFWALLLGCCCPSLQVGQYTLGKGQKCSGSTAGHCEAGLACVSNSSTDTYGEEAVCISPPFYPFCAPCSEVKCPRVRRICKTRHMTEPCGCCQQCGRQRGQLCGGRQWEKGYCDTYLSCALFVGHEPALPPHTGVCKELPGLTADAWEDPLCPWKWGCSIRTGVCDCYNVQTCYNSHHGYDDPETCQKEVEVRMYGYYEPLDENPSEPEPVPEPVPKPYMSWGCDLQGDQCVCSMKDIRIRRLSPDQCEDLREKARCSNVHCPEIPAPPCPADSFLTEPFTPPDQCCPQITAICTCNFENCPKAPTTCPPGSHVRRVKSAEGRPGDCCHMYQCV